eukprot:9319992-Pyramimonas_sp.AAC.1
MAVAVARAEARRRRCVVHVNRFAAPAMLTSESHIAQCAKCRANISSGKFHSSISNHRRSSASG